MIPSRTLQSVKTVASVLNRNMSTADLKQIFESSVNAVLPANLIKREVALRDGHLAVRDRTYPLDRPCYVVGFGKAVFGMATEIEKVLGPRLQRGVVTVPVGIFEKFCRPRNSKIEFIEGAENNLPDRNAVSGAVKIKELVEGLTENDLLIVLISGGGSALLPIPVPPIKLDEKQDIIRRLARSGANIEDLNTVRKSISVLKGGGLALLAHPAQVISLILSDVVGDPLGFIASGPTTPPSDGADENAVEVLRKYGLEKDVPESVKTVLERGKNLPCTGVVVVNGEYEHVKNYVIGNNKLAAEAAKLAAQNKAFQSVVVSTRIDGDVVGLSKIYAALARNLASLIGLGGNKDELEHFLKGTLQNELRVESGIVEEIMGMDFGKGICLIFAGEPTVLVRGKGKGGRNQQLALSFSTQLDKLIGREDGLLRSVDVSFLSCGTDGIDGPTDSAGAVSDSGEARWGGIDPQVYLDNNDCYSFYEKYKGGANLVKIGHTGTNVMDLHVLVVKSRSKCCTM